MVREIGQTFVGKREVAALMYSLAGLVFAILVKGNLK